MKFVVSLLVVLCCCGAQAQLGGFNLTESNGFLLDASPTGAKTDAQNAVDQIKRLGSKHVEINVRATMITGQGTELIPVTPPSERSNELRRIVRLVQYIHSQGMTAGLRPIFFVVGPNGEFPYTEKLADGKTKIWWHGNIQPSDPNRWFESFRTYMDAYISVANFAKADEFTIGAELYSMTVGVEDQWKEYPYGFPGRWLTLLRYVKTKLPRARIMYDINFTDDSSSESGFEKSGGELERWRYRLVDLANPTRPEEKQIWDDLIAFWKELDAPGIDMYRSLASPDQRIPRDYPSLVKLLKQRTDSYASQLDTALTEIAMVTGVEKKVFFKEIGYRSVEKGFIDPFIYASEHGQVNSAHQAAAYEAFLKSFWEAKWPWFGGVSFWDVAVDPSKKGPMDLGFSPLGKKQTEDLILKDFNATP